MRTTIAVILFFVASGVKGQPLPGSETVPWTDSTIARAEQLLDSLYAVAAYNDGIEWIEILSYHFQKNNNLPGEIWCCNRMGDFMRALGDFENSMMYLRRGLDLNSNLQVDTLLMQTYNLLAATFFQIVGAGHYDSTEKYAGLSLSLAREKKDYKQIYSNLNILGFVRLIQDKPGEALQLLREAREITRDLGSADEALILINMARAYEKLGDLKQAEKLALQSFEMGKTNNITIYVRLSSDFLRSLYLKAGNNEKAYRFLNELNQVSEILVNQRAERKIRDIESRYLFKTMEQENERLKLEDLSNKKKLIQRRINTILLLGLVVCALVFLGIFYKQKRRLRRINKELDTTNATLKKFISIIAHDLKNPFNTIIGFSDLLNTEFDSLTPEERKLAIENTHKSAVSAFSLLEQLLDWARLQTGAFKLEITRMNLSEVVDDVMNLLQTSAFLKKQKVSNQIPATLEIHADRNMMHTVFRNLISNAIKFTPESGEIRLTAVREAHSVIVRVTDTGVGIPAVDLDKLFRIEDPFKTTGTRGEKGSGIGLLLCQEYLEKNNGSISVESREGEGTTFTVVLPCVES